MADDTLHVKYSKDEFAKAQRMFEAMFGKPADEGDEGRLAAILEGLLNKPESKPVQKFKRPERKHQERHLPREEPDGPAA